MLDISKYDSDVLSESVDKVRCEKSFYYFFKCAWNVIDTESFVDNWHIECICNHMQAVFEGKFRFLVINIPPRFLKTQIVSVAFHPWVWIHDPKKKFFTGSRGKALAIGATTLARTLICSDWYQRRWGDRFALDPRQNEKMFYRNDKGGYRKIYSTYSNITGEGGNVLLVDDPLDASDAWSKPSRESVRKVISQSLMSRMNDRQVDSLICIMQRLHVEDPTAYFLHLFRNDGVQHLMLPMEFEVERRCKTILFEDPRTFEGELLFPERFGHKELDVLKEALGDKEAAAQLQQRPRLAEGNILKISKMVPYKEAPEFGFIIQSWDTAFKEGKRNDYSVCLTMGVASNGFYIMDMYRNKMAYPELRERAVVLNDFYIPSVVLVEDKASGQSLIQDLKDTTRLPIIEVAVDKDKEARTHAVTGMIDSGRVFVPENAAWLGIFFDEVSEFPYSKNDDIVDSLTMALNYLRSYGRGAPRVLRM